MVFCDLVDSVALAAEIDPEDLTEILSAFHRAVARSMREFGGFVARFMGDGALTYFGYPQAHEDDTERAVHAALKTLESVAALALPNERRLQVRIGIATGLVVVGDVIGTGDALGLDVAGATPNLAARLQGLAAPNTILVAEETRRMAGDLFEWKSLGLLNVKGLSQPVGAWQALGIRPVSSRFDAQHGELLAPMVGRDAERAELVRLWKSAQAGRGQVVLLSGEAGIGKSRLSAELLHELQGQPHARVRFFSSSHRQHSPLHPCIQQIEFVARFAPGDSAEDKLAKLEAMLGHIPEQDLQLIAELLLIPTGARFPVLQFSPQKKQERVMRALLGVLERMSRRLPLLTIFEDAHWSDESSRELLAMTVKSVADLNILLVITARPEFEPAWVTQPHVTHLVLDQLAAEESAKLIGWIARGNPLPRRVIDEIVARTDGVPLFLEEVTQAIVEGGGVADALAGRKEHTGVPPALQASLVARLDRLGAGREIAEVAAVIGRDFTSELVSLVADHPEPAVQVALARLLEAGLVVPRRTVEGVSIGFSFRHMLIRDAAHGMLVRERRRSLHARVAEALESHFPERAEAQPEIIAQHCTEGALREKAAGYWLRAGHQAMRRSAMKEALVHLRRGLEVLQSLTENDWRVKCELDLTTALGKAQIATQGYAVASTGDTFVRARALCNQLGDPPQLLSVLHGLWTHALLRGELNEARDQALSLLERGAARNDALWQLMGCRFSGVTHHPLGAFGRAREFLERGLRLYDPARRATYAEITIDDPKVVMLVYLSWSLMCVGRFTEARRASAEALAYARQLANAYTLAHALNGASFIALTIDSPEAGLQHLDELMPLLEEHGIAYYGAVGALFRGYCLAALGRADEAKAQLRNGMTAYRATGSGLFVSGFLRMSAEAYGRIGETSLALECIRESFSVMETTSQRWDEAEIHRVYGGLLLASGDRDGAGAQFRRALALAQEREAGLWELRAACDLARLLAEQGVRREAHALLAPICERAGVHGDAPDLWTARSMLASLG